MITIPCRLYSSKNNRKIMKFGNALAPVKNDRAQQNHTDLHTLLLDAGRKNQWRAMLVGKEYPLQIKFKYYPPDAKKWDHINMFQNLLDAMQAAGWLPDDDYAHVCPVFDPVVIVDKNKPRVELFIL